MAEKREGLGWFKEESLPPERRIGPEGRFFFSCGPHRTCFGRCCADANVFLTPYDVLRLKKRLGIPSGEFLSKFAVVPAARDQQVPAVLLKMREDAEKSCPFRDPGGACSVYADRPWACRMFPLAEASPAAPPEASSRAAETACFVLEESWCLGREQGKEWTAEAWRADQGLAPYLAANEEFRKLTLPLTVRGGRAVSPQQMAFFFQGCYDLDTFRRFVFESSFRKRFEVDDVLAARLKADDEALLAFAFLWLKFAIFGEMTLKVRPGASVSSEAAVREIRDAEERGGKG